MDKSAENTILIENNMLFSHIEELISTGERVELHIKGRSMHPTLLDRKDKVVLRPCSETDIHIGAIVLFRYHGRHILHRIIEINNSTLTLRGDNCIQSEQDVCVSDIIAVVAYIIKQDGTVINCSTDSYKKKTLRLLYILPIRNKYRLWAKRIKKWVKHILPYFNNTHKKTQ